MSNEDLGFIDEINGTEYEEFPEFRLLPEGIYKAEITGVEVSTKENSNKAVIVKLRVNHDGFEYNLMNNMWVRHKNETAQNIGAGTMKRLYQMLGYPYIPKDNIGVIVSRTVSIEIKHTPGTTKKGEPTTYANIKKFIGGDLKPKASKKEPIVNSNPFEDVDM